MSVATCPSGQGAVCKTAYTGSIPVVASKHRLPAMARALRRPPDMDWLNRFLIADRRLAAAAAFALALVLLACNEGDNSGGGPY